MKMKRMILRGIGLTALLAPVVLAPPAEAQLLSRATYEDIQLNGNFPLAALSDRVETTDPFALGGQVISLMGEPENASCEEDFVGEWFCEFEWPGISASYVTAQREPFFNVREISIDSGFIELDGDTLHIGDTVDGLAAMFPDAWESREERCGVWDYEPCAWYVQIDVEPESPTLVFRYEGWWVTKIIVSDSYPV